VSCAGSAVGVYEDCGDDVVHPHVRALCASHLTLRHRAAGSRWAGVLLIEAHSLLY
jgi:hypothetical protein